MTQPPGDDPQTPPPGAPDPYGAPSTWQYGYPVAPPPRRTPAWAWALIGLGTAALLAVVGFGVWFSGFWYIDDYAGYEDDGYYYVDQDSVTDALDQPCEDLDDVVADIRPFGPDGPADLDRLAEAVRAIPAAIAGADPDEDAQDLGKDWTKVAEELDEYRAAVAAGDEDAEVRLLRSGVVDRIYTGNDVCYVPIYVQLLDRDYANQFAY